MRVRRKAAAVLAASLSALCATGHAAAAGKRRQHFEPTDLSLEDPGVLSMDLQLGPVRGQTQWRAVAPDFELGLGLFSNAELALAGAWSVEGPASGPFSFDHSEPDNLWPAVKLGLYDQGDEAQTRTIAVGMQLGPKLPTARGARGVGYEALALTQIALRRTRLVVNAGGLVDPGAAVSSGRPVGLELGVDFERDLDENSVLSITAELGALLYVTHDPDALQATAGMTWSVSPSLDLSAVGLVGWGRGADPVGFLLGVSPRVRLWR